MNKNVQPKYRTGVGARAINTRWVSDIGASKGNHINTAEGGGKTLTGIRAAPYKDASFRPVPLGNALVNNVGQGGPGKGREVFKSGSQQGLQSPKSRPSGTFE